MSEFSITIASMQIHAIAKDVQWKLIAIYVFKLQILEIIANYSIACLWSSNAKVKILLALASYIPVRVESGSYLLTNLTH